MNQIHTLSYTFNIKLLSYPLHLDCLSGLLPSGLHMKSFYASLFSPMHENIYAVIKLLNSDWTYRVGCSACTSVPQLLEYCLQIYVLLRDRTFWFRGLSHLSRGYRGNILLLWLLLWVQLLGLIWSPNQWVNVATIHSHLEISCCQLSVSSQSWVRDSNKVIS